MALSRRTGARFQASIWPGFVDAMTGLLLVLMFVLTIFMVVQFVLRETISGQESELNTLAGEVAALAQALGLEEQRSAGLETRLSGLNDTLSDAQVQLAEQSSIIATLTSERDAQSAALAAAEAEITGFEAQVAGLLAQRDAARVNVSELEAREAELLSEQEALNLALESLRGEVDSQNEQARLAAAQADAMQALIADLQSEKSDATQRIEQLNSDLAAAQDSVSAQEQARLLEAAAAEALRARLANADAELTAMTLALEEQRKQAEDTLTLLAAARATGDALDAELADALSRISILQEVEGTLSETQKSAAQLAQDNADLMVELDQMRQALSAAEQAIEAGNEDVSTLRTRLAAAETQLASGRDEAVSLQDQLARALAEKQAANAQTASTQTEIDRREVLLKAAQDALTVEKETTRAAQQQSLEAQRQTELLNQQVAALRTQLGDLQALLDDAVVRDAAKDVQIQSLASQVNTALARALAQETRARALEEEDRKRLEAEAQDLEKYRSEFFGRLRDLLGNQEGIRIEGDRFVFSSEVLFPPGGADLSVEGQAEIAKVASILRSIANDIPAGIDWVIRVDGHTDNVPLLGTGEFADNWELSQARALSVVKYMVNFLGIPPSRLAANGFGQHQPVNLADTAAARAQNRRIELKFTEK
ncbi:peptidoglycan -binding protein [Ascidiaceihabitans sp.]|uniref:peptidoglycan -binding protein n=1 Tax=Ascidiaceihabitans sp. TaxID=1872644 RepID=UPI003297CF27